MSWYVGQDGQQVWVKRDETIFTVVVAAGKPPIEQLAYLATHTKKASYQEHVMVEDQLLDGKSKVPRRHRMKGVTQRGFIVRTDLGEEVPLERVVPWFKGAAQQLLEAQLISRVDAEESASLKRKKKGEKDKEMPVLGANECRAETTTAINHFAHGPGFRVEVTDGNTTQRLHFFTRRREVPFQEWQELLVEAIKASGSLVRLAKKETLEAGTTAGGGVQDGVAAVAPAAELKLHLKKDRAQQEDDAWLASMLTTCMAKERDARQEGEEDGGEIDDLEASSSPQPRVPPQPPERRPAAAAAPPAAGAAVGTPAAAWRSAKAPAQPAGAAPATSRSQQLREDLSETEWRRRDKRPEEGQGARQRGKQPRQQPPRQLPRPVATPAAASQASSASSRSVRPISAWAGYAEVAARAAAPAPAANNFDGHKQGATVLLLLKGAPEVDTANGSGSNAAWGEEGGDSWQWASDQNSGWHDDSGQHRGRWTRHQGPRGEEPAGVRAPAPAPAPAAADAGGRRRPAAEAQWKPVPVATSEEICEECGRGGKKLHLKLFWDEVYQQWFCRVCWLEFYKAEPA